MRPPFQIHTILEAAHRSVPEHLRPQPPYHLGGPRPHLPKRAQVEVTVSVLQQALAVCALDPGPTFEDALSQIRHYLGTSGDFQLSLATSQLLPEVGDVVDKIGLCAWYSTRDMHDPELHTNAVDSVAAKAIRHTTRLVTHHASESVADFLRFVDEEITRREYVAWAGAYLPNADLDVVRVLWRKSTGTYLTGHWIVRLLDRYGLMSNTSYEGWAWFEGARDNVLASVPDKLFEEAAAAVYRYDVQAA